MDQKGADLPLREAINLLNEIQSHTGYLNLRHAGQAVLLERLALASAKLEAAFNGWVIDADSNDLKTKDGKFVNFKLKLQHLFAYAGLQLSESSLKTLVRLRNDTLHGKGRDIDLMILHDSARALSHLLVLTVLGLVRYTGDYYALSIWPETLNFPSDHKRDLTVVENMLSCYPV